MKDTKLHALAVAVAEGNEPGSLSVLDVVVVVVVKISVIAKHMVVLEVASALE